MKKSLFALACLPIVFACNNPKEDPNKSQIYRLSLAHITHMQEGDIDAFVADYSENYIDLSGGMDGNGHIDFVKWSTALKNFTNSEKFEEVKNQHIDSLLLLEDRVIYDFAEAKEEKIALSGYGFDMKEGDYFVRIPAPDDSPFQGGWEGFYRMENNEWKIIAGE